MAVLGCAASTWPCGMSASPSHDRLSRASFHTREYLHMHATSIPSKELQLVSREVYYLSIAFMGMWRRAGRVRGFTWGAPPPETGHRRDA